MIDSLVHSLPKMSPPEIWSRLAALVLIPALLLWLMPLQLKMGWHPAQGAGLGGLIAFAGIGEDYVLKFSVPAIYAIDPMAVPAVMTSSTISTRPFSGAPTMAPPSPWALASLRLKDQGRS